MDWEDCKNRKFVKSIKEDKNLVSSLIESSEKKFKTNKKLEFEEVTCSTKISIIYESLREVLEALAIKKGYKIYNHECFCAFLDEICKNKSFSVDFDKFRKIRNKINYYGKNILTEEAKIISSEIILLRSKIIKKYFSKNE